ncbi:DNA repair protein RecO [Paenimyroides tangerinum]|uniref:DNA repair protein RecO n=1 Tax=Paenimyroides tangerinum TaxID=2488728 RepID=A0A3P3W7D7_9FLAO|nr:DNA repair protein RecO [Paenimyroides tangerinum]RRJ90348.1 DNA repair protein RecO [Paenimyroides tangerinum]
MLVKTKAIVFSAIRYQEKSLIVKCFTEQAGVKTYFIRNAFSKAKNAQNRVYFQPLTLLEIEADHKNKSNLEYIKSVSLGHPYHSLNIDYVKNVMGIFLAEFLSNAIKEEEPNKQLYSFIETALLWFDNHEGSANFHLYFILELTKYLGFYFDDSDEKSFYFNAREGVFVNQFNPDCFNEEETILLRKLMRFNLTDNEKIFSANERRNLLRLLVSYYQKHVVNFKEPNSLNVLIEVFS